MTFLASASPLALSFETCSLPRPLPPVPAPFPALSSLSLFPAESMLSVLLICFLPFSPQESELHGYRDLKESVLLTTVSQGLEARVTYSEDLVVIHCITNERAGSKEGLNGTTLWPPGFQKGWPWALPASAWGACLSPWIPLGLTNPQ